MLKMSHNRIALCWLPDKQPKNQKSQTQIKDRTVNQVVCDKIKDSENRGTWFAV